MGEKNIANELGEPSEIYMRGLEFFMSNFLRERPVFNPNGEDRRPSVSWWKKTNIPRISKVDVIPEFSSLLEVKLADNGGEPDDRLVWLKKLQSVYDVVDEGYRETLIDTKKKADYLLDILSHLRNPYITGQMAPGVARDVLSIANRRYEKWVRENNLQVDVANRFVEVDRLPEN